MQREIKTLEEAVLALREMYGPRSGAHIRLYADGSAGVYQNVADLNRCIFYVARYDPERRLSIEGEGLIFEDGTVAPPPARGFSTPKR